MVLVERVKFTCWEARQLALPRFCEFIHSFLLLFEESVSGCKHVTDFDHLIQKVVVGRYK